MTPQEIEAYFTRQDGSYAFARWGCPIAPIVFGVDDATLSVVKGAIEAMVQLSGHQMVETDPELGANLMLFFFSEWDELLEVPDLDHLVPDLASLVERLKDAEANQYRIFRFDDAGGIKASFVFLRMDAQLSQMPAETLALGQVVQSVLMWSDAAFRDRAPLAKVPGKETVILRPDIAALIAAAYDPVMPVHAADPSHALRLSARLRAG
ncbi:hypothetical protein G5B38_15085 [Pseudohalocynthiibacter aestuariivivens]|nr:hypothetical protein [Pseudohalocynthiibacter aestuariivivens]QIE46740.1 hypothetical protein G5B38_15085 [Pseudohalocynthiibacter aestuariivivens]